MYFFIFDMSLTDGRTLSEILSSGPYKIPAFQRDYSWKKPQILEFWNDAVDVFDSKESSYFFGPVVFIKNDKMSYHRVVDGQQRLTSVEILISVIRDIFESNDSVRLATIMQNFLYPITSIDHTDPILVLNENNNQFYKNVLLKPMDPDEKINQYKTKDPNELRLYENYKILYSKVKKKFLKSNKKGDKEENEKLFEFIRKILDSFKVYEIVVDSEDRAFRLFATLNQRGLDLGISDLVKNYIFMKSDKEHRDEFHGYWKKIIENLDDKNDLDDFLRDRRKKLRENVRRSLRKLNNTGRLKLKLFGVNEKEEALASLSKLMTAHAGRWPYSWRFQTFYDNLVDRCLELGVFTISELCLDTEPISWRMLFSYQDRLYLYMTAFEQKMAALSPGKAHLASLVEYVLARGIRVIEMGRGDEPYKSLWSSECISLIERSYYMPSLTAKMKKSWQGRIRPAIRALKRKFSTIPL